MATTQPTMLTFTLLSFPIKLTKATETPVEVKNLCPGSNGKPAHDPKPLVAPRRCPDCGEITDGYANIVKGIKQGSAYAIVTQQEVAQAKADYHEQFKKQVTLVPHDSVDFEKHTVPNGSTYFVTPTSSVSEDHYQLLVTLIQTHPELSFVTMHTLRSAAYQWRMIVRDGVLVMEQRQRGALVKASPSVGGTVNPGLLAVMEGALPTFVQPYDPNGYEDTFLDAIGTLAAKATHVVAASGGKATTAPTPIATVSDDDLMAKLSALSGAA